MAGGGRCSCVGWRRVVLQEDNVRFVLHAVFMTSFCLLGALVFSNLEAGSEQQQRAAYVTQLDNFISDNPEVNISQLNLLLAAHAIASTGGFLNSSRPRWDFAGSLFYVGTLVSTIGFGMTTCRTPAGRLVSIAFGLVGCSGFILFFNLFLERVITLTTFLMRQVNVCWTRRRRQRKDSDDVISTCTQPADVASIESAAGSAAGDSHSSQQSGSGSGSGGGGGGGGGGNEAWKPPVYLVMVVLFLAVVLIGCLSALVYSYAEQWAFDEAFYFTFSLFATVGFGDYVPLQRRHYEHMNAYRACNALILVVGCSCMYSLFNVFSIVIKQMLNVCVHWLSVWCKKLAVAVARRRHWALPGSSHFWRRRNAIAPWQPGTSNGYRNSTGSGGVRGAKNGERHSSLASVVNGKLTSNGNCQQQQQQQQQQGRKGKRTLGFRNSGGSGGGRGGRGVQLHHQMEISEDSSGDFELNAQQLVGMNQMSLAVLQKQLHDMALAHRHGGLVNNNHVIAQSANGNGALKEGVGPLAMLNTKFGS